MILSFSEALSAPGQEIPFTLEGSFDPIDWNGDTLCFIGPVLANGKCAAAGETIVVYGAVRATVQAPCARCLADATRTVHAKMEALFARQADPDDPDVWVYEGHQADLSDVVLGAILMDLPMQMFCRADCQGLCPQCGANRNQTQCSCQKDASLKQPLSALASLLKQDEEV